MESFRFQSPIHPDADQCACECAHKVRTLRDTDLDFRPLLYVCRFRIRYMNARQEVFLLVLATVLRVWWWHLKSTCRRWKGSALDSIRRTHWPLPLVSWSHGRFQTPRNTSHPSFTSDVMARLVALTAFLFVFVIVTCHWLVIVIVSYVSLVSKPVTNVVQKTNKINPFAAAATFVEHKTPEHDITGLGICVIKTNGWMSM